ncbi:MAG: efflux RND transporter periplasmic adaptor subunit [Candidatus Berkiellales bacterium]
MKKRMVIMLIGMFILFGGIFAYQIFKNTMMKKHMSKNISPPVTVSAMTAKTELWQQHIKASGSLRAVEGVDVTTEIAGLVRNIYFTPGAQVKKDEMLVALNDDTEVAQLHSLEATLEIAKITYERDKAQQAIHAVSQQTLDNDAATLKSAQAQVMQQKALIAKKLIKAPFAGKLGISHVNLGQYLNAGDMVVTLQKLDPIYVDFYVPQQELTNLGIGQSVTLTTDTFPGKKFIGKITTIDPKIDPNTRNIEIEATLNSPKQLLLPGMFGTAEVNIGQDQHFITLPQTAISFNPYGEIAYIIKEQGKDKQGKPILIANQILVVAGKTRGDQVAVVKGVNEGDQVVISGQLKLKNGSVVIINNSVMPSNNPAPQVVNY